MTTESDDNTVISSAGWDDEEEAFVIDIELVINQRAMRCKITDHGIHTTLYTEKLIEGVEDDGIYELTPIGEWDWSHLEWADFIETAIASVEQLHEEN